LVALIDERLSADVGLLILLQFTVVYWGHYAWTTARQVSKMTPVFTSRVQEPWTRVVCTDRARVRACKHYRLCNAFCQHGPCLLVLVQTARVHGLCRRAVFTDSVVRPAPVSTAREVRTRVSKITPVLGLGTRVYPWIRVSCTGSTLLQGLNQTENGMQFSC